MMALLLAIGVVTLLAGIIWGVVTTPGQAVAPGHANAGATAVAPLPAQQEAGFRPQRVAVEPVAAGARVSWSAPGDAAAVTAYIVIAERGGHTAQERTLGAATHDAVFAGLLPGQRYCFVVGSLVEAADGQPATAAAAPACTTTGS
jgi:hypothetical protein